jgi:hypothetical protein
LLLQASQPMTPSESMNSQGSTSCTKRMGVS